MDIVKFTNGDGIEVDCEVMSIYNSERTKKSYVIFTDKTFNNNKKNVYANEFVEKDGEIILSKVNDNFDRMAIEKLIESL